MYPRDVLSILPVALLVGLALVAVVAGFAGAAGVMIVTNLVWPFNYPADDDSIRERLPVVAAYAAWVLVALATFVVGLRRLLRPR